MGGWEVDQGQTRGASAIKQPRTYPERLQAAATCRKFVKLDLPVLVDTMDDRVASLYGAAPIRIYVIDRQGKVAYKGGRGLFGFKPAEAERSLIWLLRSEPAAAR